MTKQQATVAARAIERDYEASADGSGWGHWAATKLTCGACGKADWYAMPEDCLGSSFDCTRCHTTNDA